MERVPILFGCKLPPLSFSRATTSHYLDVDVFGSTFFMLARYEEAVFGAAVDSHGRFPASESVAKKANILDRPLVNEYLEMLWNAIHRLWPSLTRKNRTYRALLSHDVDDLTLRDHSWKQIGNSLAADLLIRKEPNLARRRLAAVCQARWGRPDYNSDPYNTFDFIMDTSDRHGLRSAFNFVSSARRGKLDPTYVLDEGWVKNYYDISMTRGTSLAFTEAIILIMTISSHARVAKSSANM